MLARQLGEPGFVVYLHELRRLRVLSRREVVGWLGLHGAVIRMLEPPLDDGETFDEHAFAELSFELGEKSE